MIACIERDVLGHEVQTVNMIACIKRDGLGHEVQCQYDCVH